MSKSNPSFEENILRLEQIVRALERGDVPLQESLELFQEGTTLVKSCQTLLDQAKLQVQVVMTDENGEVKLEEFDHVES